MDLKKKLKIYKILCLVLGLILVFYLYPIVNSRIDNYLSNKKFDPNYYGSRYSSTFDSPDMSDDSWLNLSQKDFIEKVKLVIDGKEFSCQVVKDEGDFLTVELNSGVTKLNCQVYKPNLDNYYKIESLKDFIDNYVNIAVPITYSIYNIYLTDKYTKEDLKDCTFDTTWFSNKNEMLIVNSCDKLIGMKFYLNFTKDGIINIEFKEV